MHDSPTLMPFQTYLPSPALHETRHFEECEGHSCVKIVFWLTGCLQLGQSWCPDFEHSFVLSRLLCMQ